MADYAEQLNQARAQDEEGEGEKGRAEDQDAISGLPVSTSQITLVEWLLVGAVAILADIMLSAGFILVPIILLWHTLRFRQFPFKKLLFSGGSEIISAGFLPGWIGFVIWIFLEQKGFLPDWLKKLAGKTSKT